MHTVPGGTVYSEPAQELPPPVSRRAGSTVAGFVVRLFLLLLIGCIGLVAAALLLTPTREAVLVMGSDARPDELKRGEAGRTDTLLLVVADRATPRLALLSVPRDLWVAIPGHGEERINAAFELGGGQTAKQTVGNALGQRVDRYVLIGLQGVRDVVDAVGGVDVTVPVAIHDETYPTDDYGYQTVDIPAGRQHMDGDTALKYARTRHQDNDFARTARQQQVVGAIRSAMLSPANWPRIPSVLVTVLGAIKTDVSPLDAIGIGAAILRNPGEPERMVIDPSLAREVTGQDGAYLLEAKPDLKPAVARFLGATSVEVLNGAGIAGLASRTADKLSQSGYIIASIGDAPRPQSQTTIIARPSARSAAEQLANTLGIPSVRVSTNANLTTADVQLVLGTDAH